VSRTCILLADPPGLLLLASVYHGSAQRIVVGGGVNVGTVVVDSTFEPANRSATSFSAGAWIPVSNGVEIGAESGIVYRRSSWFIGPAPGGQYGRVRVEAIARRHVTSFDEVTRDYGSGTTHEISRNDRSENSWGVVTRFLLLTR
jgi:hypothetical protein